MSWLFGHRFAVVTYKGRRSDRTCRTVLWVYRYLPDTGAITVVSVWGDSDWLRNIRSKPATLIQAGRNGFVAGQQFLGTGQIVALVKAFRRDHRWIAPGQARLMRWPWPATDEQLRTICGQMRAVTFSPALHGPCDTSGMGRGPRERSLSSASGRGARRRSSAGRLFIEPVSAGCSRRRPSGWAPGTDAPGKHETAAGSDRTTSGQPRGSGSRHGVIVPSSQVTAVGSPGDG
jgi:hypothetical protein